MRMRQRHLSAGRCGANFVLDARAISLSDGTEISNWSDTSGNGNSAQNATAGLRPTFRKTGLSGMPSAQFDGSDDFTTIANAISSDSVYVVVKLESDVNHGLMGDFHTGSGGGSAPTNQVIGWHSGSYKFAKAGSESWNGSGEYVFADRVFWNNVDATNGDSNIGLACFDRNSRAAYSYPGSSANRIGNQRTTFVSFNGHLSYLASFPTSLSDSMRKKLSHSLAYSFRFKCA